MESPTQPTSSSSSSSFSDTDSQCSTPPDHDDHDHDHEMFYNRTISNGSRSGSGTSSTNSDATVLRLAEEARIECINDSDGEGRGGGFDRRVATSIYSNGGSMSSSSSSFPENSFVLDGSKRLKVKDFRYTVLLVVVPMLLTLIPNMIANHTHNANENENEINQRNLNSFTSTIPKIQVILTTLVIIPILSRKLYYNISDDILTINVDYIIKIASYKWVRRFIYSVLCIYFLIFLNSYFGWVIFGGCIYGFIKVFNSGYVREQFMPLPRHLQAKIENDDSDNDTPEFQSALITLTLKILTSTYTLPDLSSRFLKQSYLMLFFLSTPCLLQTIPSIILTNSLQEYILTKSYLSVFVLVLSYYLSYRILYVLGSAVGGKCVGLWFDSECSLLADDGNPGGDGGGGNTSKGEMFNGDFGYDDYDDDDDDDDSDDEDSDSETTTLTKLPNFKANNNTTSTNTVTSPSNNHNNNNNNNSNNKRTSTSNSNRKSAPDLSLFKTIINIVKYNLGSICKSALHGGILHTLLSSLYLNNPLFTVTLSYEYEYEYAHGYFMIYNESVVTSSNVVTKLLRDTGISVLLKRDSTSRILRMYSIMITLVCSLFSCLIFIFALSTPNENENENKFKSTNEAQEQQQILTSLITTILTTYTTLSLLFSPINGAVYSIYVFYGIWPKGLRKRGGLIEFRFRRILEGVKESWLTGTGIGGR